MILDIKTTKERCKISHTVRVNGGYSFTTQRAFMTDEKLNELTLHNTITTLANAIGLESPTILHSIVDNILNNNKVIDNNTISNILSNHTFYAQEIKKEIARKAKYLLK